jgi:hypothetical protein
MTRDTDGKQVLVATTNNPNNDPSSIYPDNLQISTTPDSTAKSIEWALVGVGAGLAILGIAGGIASKVMQVTENAATVTQTAAQIAQAQGTFTNAQGIVYTQLPTAAQAAGVQAAIAAIRVAAGTATAATNALFIKRIIACVAFGILLGGVPLAIGLTKMLSLDNLTDQFQGKLGSLEPLDNFIKNWKDAGQWPNSTNWQLVDAQLQDALVLYGNLT